MTNAEKYKEVFGMEHPDCPTWHCPTCPVFEGCSTTDVGDERSRQSWWEREYKEKDNDT